ncbi:hypothetical protein V6C42_11260 [Pseudoclostridium thermosuccinogenes]|uniref:hypothetical protein n=1 Tax=Clostridium thermosuccinogenes TaxID=84032 RepID=UPI002FDB3E9A
MIYAKDKKQEYVYSIYGLNIASEIPMPELPAIDKKTMEGIDASVALGKANGNIEDGVVINEFLKVSGREFYLHIEGTARYYVADGSRIIVEPETWDDMDELKTFLLGSCLGMLMYQRDIVAMHGSGVMVDGQGIIITGHTGAGKSTLTSALRKEGCKFLADDISALTMDDDGSILMHPACPQAKLCRDAMVRMGYNPDEYKKTDNFRDKYIIPLKKHFLGNPVPLDGIFEIKTGDGDRTEVREVKGIEKIRLVLRNIYRIEIIRYLGLKPSYFQKCLVLASRVPMYSITRPKSCFTVDEQARLIRSTLAGLKGSRSKNV